MVKRTNKFSLRVLLSFVLAVALLFAMGANWCQPRSKQIQAVDGLIQMARETETAGLYDRTVIAVYYGGDLVWLEDEGRYVTSFEERYGISKWLNGKIGVDFFESPTVIEIMCRDFDDSKLTDDIVRQIKQLDSVKQIWITDRAPLADPGARQKIAQLFSSLIIDSPHRWTQLPN